MLKLLARTSACAALIALPLSACGGGSSSSGCGSPAADASPAVTVHALDALKFDQKNYTAPAGDIVIDYVNDGSLAHTLKVEGKDCKLSVNSRGATDKGTINLTAGDYTIFCDIPGHESAGMKATLTVS
jgi:plastocyanin